MKDKNNLEPSDYKTSVSGSLNGLEALEEIVDYAINEFTDNEKKYQKDLETIEKELKALELIKGINFDIVYREQLDEWTLFIVTESQDGEPLEPVTFGSGKEQYELLKEVLL